MIEYFEKLMAKASTMNRTKTFKFVLQILIFSYIIYRISRGY